MILSDVIAREIYTDFAQPESRPFAKGLEILIKDFEHTIKIKDGFLNIIIPESSIWDGASIPRISWSLTGSPFLPEFRKASLVHDYIYNTGCMTRKQADKEFLRLLLNNGVSKYTAYKMYYAVRMGGVFGWRKWRKKDKL